MSEPSSILELPFDQYQRYRLVADIVEQLRPAERALTILDVGGRTALLRRFLPRDRVELVDLEASSERGLVLGDGAALPFRDRAVDLVCAFDTLEHVPPPLRASFVRECARVARHHVVIAGPYESPRVVEGEKLLQRFLREKLGFHHRYLEEHRGHGLPDRAALERELIGLGGRVVAVGHGNVERWLFLMCVALYMDLDPALRGLARSFHAFYNRELYAADWSEPVYRHAVVAAFGAAHLPRVELLRQAGQAARAGDDASPARLLQALLAFDRERDAWSAERAAHRQIAQDLNADLTGHRAQSEQQTQEIDVLRTTLEREIAQRGIEQSQAAEMERTLRQDLGEHARTLEILRRELGELESMRAFLIGELESTHADLERTRTELEGHKGMLAETQAELARTLETARNFESEWQRVENVARLLQGELNRSDANATELGKQLGARDAELSEARRQLRSRWKNFKRAFGWKKPGA